MRDKEQERVDKHVGLRVRAQRMALSMSQEKLGDALGLTFQQVQKYEKGTNRIGASRLQQLSTILHVPVAFFFEGLGKQVGDSLAMSWLDEFAIDRNAVRIGKAFLKLSPKMKSAVADFVEEAASK